MLSQDPLVCDLVGSEDQALRSLIETLDPPIRDTHRRVLIRDYTEARR